MALGLAFSSRQGLVFIICSQLIELHNRTESVRTSNVLNRSASSLLSSHALLGKVNWL